jgi:glycosyltransferase involved in cell wall biosynthesis
MTQLTFVTALAPYHDALIARCTASVEAQTIPCNHIIIRDEDGKGAGWARNRGLEAVQTEFVAFLDADDWIEPTFAERMRDAYDGTAYLYSDWYQDDQRISAPECAWTSGTRNIITALIPTEWVRAVGGFDEALRGGEDTDFFLKLIAAGHCGKRLPEPLFHYGAEGQRSKRFIASGDKDRVMVQILAKYGGRRMADCGGCGGGNYDAPNLPDTPLNAQASGMVLARALWHGNRIETGRRTGIQYPKSGWNKLMYVYPEDIDATPHLWRRESETFAPVLPDIRLTDDTPNEPQIMNGAADVAAFLNDKSVVPDAVPQALPVAPPPAAQSEVKANLSKVTQKAKRARGKK